MSIYVCGLVCICIHFTAYCSNYEYGNLSPDIKYIFVQNILHETRNDSLFVSYDENTIRIIDNDLDQMENSIVTGFYHDPISTTMTYIFTENSTELYDLYAENHIYLMEVILIILSCMLILIVLSVIIFCIINKRSVQNHSSVDIEMGELTLPMNPENDNQSTGSITDDQW